MIDLYIFTNFWVFSSPLNNEEKMADPWQKAYDFAVEVARKAGAVCLGLLIYFFPDVCNLEFLSIHCIHAFHSRCTPCFMVKPEERIFVITF